MTLLECIENYRIKMKELGWSDKEIEEDLDEICYKPIKSGEDEELIKISLNTDTCIEKPRIYYVDDNGSWKDN